MEAPVLQPPLANAKQLGKTGVLLVNLGTPDSPSVADVRKYLREFLIDGRGIDIPFFPQYASATTGWVYEKVMAIVKDWQIIPEIRLVKRFLENRTLITALLPL